MSSVEEPPSKITKYEDLQYLEEGEECLEETLEEEGQEEWLSEGVLTDEDYVIQQDETELTRNMSQEDQTQEELPQDQEDRSKDQTPEDIKQQDNKQEYIEETLNNLEGFKEEEFPDDLDTFLIRKTDGKVVEPKIKEEPAVSKSQEENDGNDTDDLLRMLGDGEQKTKKKIVKHKPSQDKKNEDPQSSDDEFYFERSKVKTLKIAKNAIIKKAPIKAEPEDMSEGDDESEQSSDDGSTVQRIFKLKKAPTTVRTEPKKIIRHVVQVNSNSNKHEKPDSKPTPKLQNSRPITKALPPKIQPSKPPSKVEVKTPAPFKPLEKSKSEKSKSKETTSKLEGDEFDILLGEEEFLEGDDIDLDEEEFGEDSEGDSKKQRIMRPERMDEEVPSDVDTHSEGGSLYDELPSSESEDMDDWFALDIRAERAADYLPLLGTKARELLLAERRRVTGRVTSLRQSLSALTDSARRQADQLRAAAMALAEIDDTLRAA